MMLLLKMFFKKRTPAGGRQRRKKTNVRGDEERENEMVRWKSLLVRTKTEKLFKCYG